MPNFYETLTLWLAMKAIQASRATRIIPALDSFAQNVNDLVSYVRP